MNEIFIFNNMQIPDEDLLLKFRIKLNIFLTGTIPRVEVVSADTVFGSSVSIQWIPYNFTAVNHYRICLKTDPQSLNCNVSILNIDSTLAHVLVQDLAPNTLYYITMFAFTQLRVTPISEELQVETIGLLYLRFQQFSIFLAVDPDSNIPFRTSDFTDFTIITLRQSSIFNCKFGKFQKKRQYNK